ncbi:hypothetical protein PTKIN_Ptkin08bG0068900 [Pterospermum kingtungense]
MTVVAGQKKSLELSPVLVKVDGRKGEEGGGIVAESNANFKLLSSNGIYEAVELHPLIPELITSDDSASTIALQITLFPNMGFFIGITAHHAVLDGKTTTLFMKSWAYICKRGGDGDRIVGVGFTIDCRPRLDPLVLENYFRNCNTITWAMVQGRNFLDENGFDFVVQKISGMVKEVMEKGALEGIE